MLKRLAFAAIPLALAAPAQARNILIADDVGLTGNVVALNRELTDMGHDVIVSVPCMGQSGMGTAIKVFKPLTPLEAECHNGAARPGDPGAGAMTKDGFTNGDWFYANGTPTMAVLYGIDVTVKKRWGKAPDLVISGPNEGRNAGPIVLFSGTVSVTQAAAMRGVPAIATSGDLNSTSPPNAPGDTSRAIALRAAQIVAMLDRRAGSGRIVPEGMILNVNFPADPADAPIRFTQLGTSEEFRLSMAESMAKDASPRMIEAVKARGQAIPELPGIIGTQVPESTSPGHANDEANVARSAIAISPIQAGYALDPAWTECLETSMASELAGAAKP